MLHKFKDIMRSLCQNPKGLAIRCHESMHGSGHVGSVQMSRRKIGDGFAAMPKGKFAMESVPDQIAESLLAMKSASTHTAGRSFMDL